MFTSIMYVQLYYYLSPWALESVEIENVSELEKIWTNKR